METSRPVRRQPSACTQMRLRRLLSSRVCWVSARPIYQGEPACVSEVSGDASEARGAGDVQDREPLERLVGSVGAPVDTRAVLGFLGPERGWILALVLVVWAFDTAAYFTGRRFGRRPFMAHISPSKTQEGVVGGLLAAAVIGAIFVAALGRPWPAGLVMGLVVGAAAQAGDLAESMLKRAAGAKESGTLIPGHGGILDRVDSFLFAAPVAYFYVVSILR